MLAEFKRASPSMGVINEDADLEEYVKLYARYADAISILTDEKFFRGCMEFVSKARKLTSLPILAKDFYIHPVQIFRAAHYGASVVLIIVRMLDDGKIRELYETADSLGMDVIFEVHSVEEMERLLRIVEPRIVGINTRNLEDFTINRKVVDDILPYVPGEMAVIAESGIKTPEEIKNLKGKVHGVLVGTAIMRSRDPEWFLREMKRWSE